VHEGDRVAGEVVGQGEYGEPGTDRGAEPVGREAREIGHQVELAGDAPLDAGTIERRVDLLAQAGGIAPLDELIGLGQLGEVDDGAAGERMRRRDDGEQRLLAEEPVDQPDRRLIAGLNG
jgi:hypothetical protein